MLVADMRAEIHLGDALHHDHLRARHRIVDARGDGLIPRIVDALQRVRHFGLGRIDRIVDAEAVGAFAGDTRLEGAREAEALAIVLIEALDVLIADELEAIGPPALIPDGADDRARVDGVADREVFAVAREDEALRGIVQPIPRRPEDRDAQALHMPRRNVDDQVLDLPTRDRLEMLGDRVDVPIPDQRRPGFDEPPTLANEDGEAILREALLLLLDQLQEAQLRDLQRRSGRLRAAAHRDHLRVSGVAEAGLDRRHLQQKAERDEQRGKRTHAGPPAAAVRAAAIAARFSTTSAAPRS
jgi:hypothetical protein